MFYRWVIRSIVRGTLSDETPENGDQSLSQQALTEVNRWIDSNLAKVTNSSNRRRPREEVNKRFLLHPSQLPLCAIVCLEVIEFLVWFHHYSQAHDRLLLFERNPSLRTSLPELSVQQLQALAFVCASQSNKQQTSLEQHQQLALSDSTTSLWNAWNSRSVPAVLKVLVDNAFQSSQQQLNRTLLLALEEQATSTTTELTKLVKQTNVLYMAVIGDVGRFTIIIVVICNSFNFVLFFFERFPYVQMNLFSIYDDN
jgi:hypothetical protein